LDYRAKWFVGVSVVLDLRVRGYRDKYRVGVGLGASTSLMLGCRGEGAVARGGSVDV